AAIYTPTTESSTPSLHDALPICGVDDANALAMTRERAEALGVERIGDLAGATDLKVVVSHEFLERADGWPGLSRAYGLDLPVTRSEEHTSELQSRENLVCRLLLE